MPDPRPPARIRDAYVLHMFRLQHLGEPCERCERRPGAHVHHKTYRSQGGDDVERNCEWLCSFCHMDIHDGRLARYPDAQ